MADVRIRLRPCSAFIVCSKVRALKKHPRKNKTAINIEYLKARIRAKVELPFRIIKCQFGFIKARDKGVMKFGNSPDLGQNPTGNGRKEVEIGNLVFKSQTDSAKPRSIPKLQHLFAVSLTVVIRASKIIFRHADFSTKLICTIKVII